MARLQHCKIHRRTSAGSAGKSIPYVTKNGEARFYLRYWHADPVTGKGTRWTVHADTKNIPLASETQTFALALMIEEEIGAGAHNPYKYQPAYKNEWAFEKQITRWLASKVGRVEHTTYANYHRAVHQYLIPHFKLTDIKEIKGRHIADFVTAAPAYSTKGRVKGKLSPKSIKELVDVLAVFFNWAVRSEDLIEKCPTLPTIKVPETPITAANYATQNRILELVPDIHKPIIHFAMRHGMRNGEVLALQAGDIDFDAGTITVQRQFAKGHLRHTKTARLRILPIHPELTETLHTICSEKLPGAWVFTIDGHPYSSGRLYKVAMRAAKKMNVKITAYQLFRHSVLTQAAMRSVDPLKIQRYAGHTSLKTTQRYLDKNAITITDVQTTANVVAFPASGYSVATETKKAKNAV